MSDGPPLTPARLSELLSRLDDVLTDAAELRKQITKQLDDQRRKVQQKVTRPRRPRTTRR